MKYVPFIESKIRWRYRWTRACHFKAARSTVAWSSEMIISDAIIWIMRDAPLQGNTYGVQPGQWITLEGCILSFVLAFLSPAATASHRASSKEKQEKKRNDLWPSVACARSSIPSYLRTIVYHADKTDYRADKRNSSYQKILKNRAWKEFVIFEKIRFLLQTLHFLFPRRYDVKTTRWFEIQGLFEARIIHITCSAVIRTISIRMLLVLTLEFLRQQC